MVSFVIGYSIFTMEQILLSYKTYINGFLHRVNVFPLLIIAEPQYKFIARENNC